MALSQTIQKKFKKFVNLKIFPGFKFLNLIFFSSCNKKLDAKKKISKKLAREKIRRIQPYNGTNQDYFAFYHFSSSNLYYYESNIIIS